MVHTQKDLVSFFTDWECDYLIVFLFSSPSISTSFSLLEVKSKERLISRSFIHLIGQVPSKDIHIFMKHIDICHATLHSYYVFVSCQRCPLLLEFFRIWLLQNLVFGVRYPHHRHPTPPCHKRSSKTENLTLGSRNSFRKGAWAMVLLQSKMVVPPWSFLIPCDFSV